MPIISYQNKNPVLDKNVFVADGAWVIGDVNIGADSSIWFNTVVRGDVHWIKIGANTNIQDNSVCHVSSGKHPLQIGSGVTVGHRCIVHGCEVGDYSLIGMGAIIMDGVKIGDHVLIAAGSLVTEGMIIPPGVLAMGSPCKVKRELTETERTTLENSAKHYQDLAKTYLVKS